MVDQNPYQSPATSDERVSGHSHSLNIWHVVLGTFAGFQVGLVLDTAFQMRSDWTAGMEPFYEYIFLIIFSAIGFASYFAILAFEADWLAKYVYACKITIMLGILWIIFMPVIAYLAKVL